MENVAYISKDQNYQDETTIYWFEVEGEEYGVRDQNGERSLVDCDGYTANLEDFNNTEIFDTISNMITEEIEQS